MDIAYLVIAYTDPPQLHRLVDQLSLSGDVYLHINRKVNIAPFAKELANCGRNLHWATKRYRVNWCGFSILNATFQLLEDALNNHEYDRIILLTGQDYPIKSASFIKDFFQRNNNVDFVYGDICDEKKIESIRTYYCWDYGKNADRLLRRLRLIFPKSFFIVRTGELEYNGAKYPYRGLGPKWALSGYSARKLLNFWQNNPRINRLFKSMHAPDDIYVPTVSRIIIDEKLISTEPIFYLDTIVKRNLCIDDLEVLKSLDALYARKFFSNTSDTLVDALDKYFLRNK